VLEVSSDERPLFSEGDGGERVQGGIRDMSASPHEEVFTPWIFPIPNIPLDHSREKLIVKNSCPGEESIGFFVDPKRFCCHSPTKTRELHSRR
jgi:hypothetical protein